MITATRYQAALRPMRPIGSRLRPVVGRLRQRWANWRDLTRARALVPAILAALSPWDDGAPPGTWRIRRAEWTESNVAVIAVGPAGGPAAAVLKLPKTPEGVAGLRRQGEILSTLHADARLGTWRTLLPEQIAEGEVAGHAYVVERALPGSPALPLLADPASRRRLQLAAAAAIGELHRLTATTLVVDTRLLDRWIDRPLRLIRAVEAAQLPAAQSEAKLPALDRLAAELRGWLAGRRLDVGWIHGDFWPGNVLVAPAGATPMGLVDWDRAAPDDLPLHDVLHLLLYTRRLVRRRVLGDVVLAWLDAPWWTPDELATMDAAGFALPHDVAEQRAMVLLYWLRHIAACLVQCPDLAYDGPFVARDIAAVLGRL